MTQARCCKVARAILQPGVHALAIGVAAVHRPGSGRSASSPDMRQLLRAINIYDQLYLVVIILLAADASAAPSGPAELAVAFKSLCVAASSCSELRGSMPTHSPRSSCVVSARADVVRDLTRHGRQNSAAQVCTGLWQAYSTADDCCCRTRRFGHCVASEPDHWVFW